MDSVDPPFHLESGFDAWGVQDVSSWSSFHSHVCLSLISQVDRRLTFDRLIVNGYLG